MKKFVAGLLLGILLAVAVPLLLVAAGIFSIAASEPPTAIELKIAPWVRDAAIRKRAPKEANPVANDPAALSGGMAHYRENCVMCHGAPDVEVAELAEGLHPAPPLIDDASIQKRPDGELFWIIKNGIRMTGMPAFGPTHKDDEIWKLVAFVRHAPKLTDEEKAKLRPAEEREEHHEAEEMKEAPAAKGETEHEHKAGEAHKH